MTDFIYFFLPILMNHKQFFILNISLFSFPHLAQKTIRKLITQYLIILFVIAYKFGQICNKLKLKG